MSGAAWNDVATEPMRLLQHSTTPFLLACLILAMGCDRLPGKPTRKSAGSRRRKSRIFPDSTPGTVPVVMVPMDAWERRGR